jgi:hypothetical protein
MQLSTPQPARHPNPTTKASALAYAIFDRPDLKMAEEYLIDFGLRRVSNDGQTILMRGAGPEPYCYVVHKAETSRFVGLGLEVETLADLEALSRLPGASAIEAVTLPGGGQRVRLTDPSGFVVDAIFGRLKVAELPHRPPLPLNSVDAPARVNGTQRPPFAPPEVIRLGHVALELANYQATSAWYTQHFGFIRATCRRFPTARRWSPSCGSTAATGRPTTTPLRWRRRSRRP